MAWNATSRIGSITHSKRTEFFMAIFEQATRQYLPGSLLDNAFQPNDFPLF
jgi:hypothetical protein